MLPIISYRASAVSTCCRKVASTWWRRDWHAKSAVLMLINYVVWSQYKPRYSRYAGCLHATKWHIDCTGLTWWITNSVSCCVVCELLFCVTEWHPAGLCVLRQTGNTRNVWQNPEWWARPATPTWQTAGGQIGHRRRFITIEELFADTRALSRSYHACVKVRRRYRGAEGFDEQRHTDGHAPHNTTLPYRRRSN